MFEDHLRISFYEMQKLIRLFSLILLLHFCKSEALFAQTDSSCVDMDEVVVTTGQYRPQSVKNSVYSIRVITAEQIKARAATNLIQVLNGQAGIRISNDNTLGVTDIQLMGMSGRSIKILLNGVPVMDRNDTRESLSQIDVQTIERIEIVDGPMSVIYGTDALAGVINIITKNPEKHRYSINAKVQEETVGNEYHPFSYKGMHQQSVNGSYQFKQPVTISVGLTHIDFNGFGGDDYGRAKSWLPKEQYLGNARVSYRSKKNQIFYSADFLDEIITKRGAINISSMRAFDQLYHSKRLMHQLQDQWRIKDNLQLAGVISFTNYERRTKSTNHNFETGENRPTTGIGEQDLAKFNTFFFRTQAVYTLNEQLSFQPGVELNRDNASGARIQGNPVISDYAFFLSAEYKPFNKLNIRPGLRVIKNSIYDAPPVLPALNLMLKVTPSSELRASYAFGYRAPALRELYFDFVDANHTIYGNINLKAETSRSANIGWNTAIQKTAWKTNFSVSAYYNVFKDLVDYAIDPKDGRSTILFNVDEFKTTGFLFQHGIFFRRLQLDWAASYIGRYNRLNETDNDLPKFNWSPELTANFYYNFSKPAFQLALLYKFTGARRQYALKTSDIKDGVHLTKMDSYNWMDLTATKKVWKQLSVQAGVRNIFNISNIANTVGGGGAHSTSGSVPISYGRSYFLALNLNINK